MTTPDPKDASKPTTDGMQRTDRFAQPSEQQRERTANDIEDIQHGLTRNQNPNRVRAMRTFMERRDARIYVPSSVIGARLFTLLQDMDRIYANIERGKLRAGSAKGLQEKQELETQIMTLIETLAEITATMAVANKQTDAAKDPAVVEIIRRLKAAAAEAVAEKSDTVASRSASPKEERGGKRKARPSVPDTESGVAPSVPVEGDAEAPLEVAA